MRKSIGLPNRENLCDDEGRTQQAKTYNVALAGESYEVTVFVDENGAFCTVTPRGCRWTWTSWLASSPPRGGS